MKSPFLSKEFKEAADKGFITHDEAKRLTGSWSALSNAGEATNLNLVHLKNVDVLDNVELTKAEMAGRVGV